MLWCWHFISSSCKGSPQRHSQCYTRDARGADIVTGELQAMAKISLNAVQWLQLLRGQWSLKNRQCPAAQSQMIPSSPPSLGWGPSPSCRQSWVLPGREAAGFTAQTLTENLGRTAKSLCAQLPDWEFARLLREADQFP